ncbi:MAG: hypothetical protein MI806_25890 [Minwuiales bacterium]|nr:hypothetical protein [Minwuiales bacterium]
MTDRAEAEKTWTDSLTQALRHTEGSLPLILVAPDEPTADWLRRAKVGRKHTKFVEIEVGETVGMPSLAEWENGA